MIRAVILTMILAIPAVAVADDTPDWRTAKTPVPYGWTARQQSDFEETAHGDPVWIARQRAGMYYGGSYRARQRFGPAPRRYYYPGYYYRTWR